MASLSVKPNLPISHYAAETLFDFKLAACQFGQAKGRDVEAAYALMQDRMERVAQYISDMEALLDYNQPDRLRF